jgi:hypothetical protein
LIVQLISISNLSYERVAWYTVKIEGRNLSEFRDFQLRMSENKKDEFELNEIRRFIQQIGKYLGAEAKHFKHERAAERLPPPYYYIETDDPNDFGLRLYCIRLCNEIVILLNGGRKTHPNPEKCPNCSVHFKIANRIAIKINEAILNKDIELDIENKEIIINNEDFEIEI